MAEIIFYEKPGCINGEKQKNILKAAGHVLECRNILTTQWTKEVILPFLSSTRPEEFMNYTAPDIKSGKIDPVTLQFEEALELMANNPILIKRPLLEVDGKKIQGFMNVALKPYLGDWDSGEDVTTCPNLLSLSCDEKK